MQLVVRGFFRVQLFLIKIHKYSNQHFGSVLSHLQHIIVKLKNGYLTLLGKSE